MSCFIWICCHNKILTWANLRRRGFCGPGVCLLCLLAEENTNHLFGGCGFFQSVWSRLGSQWNWLPIWGNVSLQDNLSACSALSTPCSVVAFYLVWEVWRMRNHLLFNGMKACVEVTIARISAWLSLSFLSHEQDLLHAPPLLDEQHPYPYGFFDRAAKYGDCGADIVLKLAQDHIIHVH